MNSAALAQRTDTGYTTPALARRVAPAGGARITEMLVTAATAFSLPLPEPFELGMAGMATGTDPSGEAITAIFGELTPAVGQRWRVVFNEGGDGWLDDLIRDVDFG